jgi:hypothetical protein
MEHLRSVEIFSREKGYARVASFTRKVNPSAVPLFRVGLERRRRVKGARKNDFPRAIKKNLC